MIHSLKLIFQRLIEEVNTQHYRFLYDKIDLSDRLIGLIGSRGVGKTTLLLQIIKNKLFNKVPVFYLSADHIYFENHTLYQFVEDLYLTEGIKFFFIDEIHKYPNWNREIKNLYDGFPKLHLIFSGSSSLDIIKGSYDLSRRAKMYSLPGLSFREYLNFNREEIHKPIEPISFDDLMSNPKSLDQVISAIPMIKGHFQTYFHRGFYPFCFETPLSYYERILNTIEKTIYEDISHFYSLKTGSLPIFKKILIFLAGIKPGEASVHNIAKNLSVDDKTITNYLEILVASGLITLLYPAEKGNIGLRRPGKIFLNNTNLYYVLEEGSSNKTEIGTTRELFFVQTLQNAGIQIFHSKTGDFKAGKYIFEIGGKNKTSHQIKNVENSFVVKDDIMISGKKEIPLLFFGFLY